MVGVLAIYVNSIAPAVIGLFLDRFQALLLSHAAVAIIRILLFTIFIYFMLVPITNTLRAEQTMQLEIFLAAPVKSSDVILGEYLGVLPLYAILITIVSGFFTALLRPLGLDYNQLAFTILIFVVTFLSALWIGTVIAALLRARLGKTAHGRDIGRALAIVIALPLVAVIYAIQYGGLFQIMLNPDASGLVKTILSILPSSWGADLVVDFANHPGNLAATGFEVVTRLGGLICFFVSVLWLGAKAADRAYSLEPTTFTNATMRADGSFYRVIRRIGGGASPGTLLVTLVKDFSRRLENLSMITYLVGILMLMSVFIVPQIGSRDAGLFLLPLQFIFPVIVAMLTGDITVYGKAQLFLYKKAPMGVGRFVRTALIKNWLLAVPVAGAITVFSSLLHSAPSFLMLIASSGLMMALVAAYVAFVLGVFLLNPAFSQKSLKLGINIVLTMLSSITLFMIALFIVSPVFVSSAPEGMLHLQLTQTALNWIVGLIFLMLGKRKLSRIE
jgi:hypothetical protein